MFLLKLLRRFAPYLFVLLAHLLALCRGCRLSLLFRLALLFHLLPLSLLRRSLLLSLCPALLFGLLLSILRGVLLWRRRSLLLTLSAPLLLHLLSQLLLLIRLLNCSGLLTFSLLLPQQLTHFSPRGLVALVGSARELI